MTLAIAFRCLIPQQWPPISLIKLEKGADWNDGQSRRGRGFESPVRPRQETRISRASLRRFGQRHRVHDFTPLSARQGTRPISSRLGAFLASKCGDRNVGSVHHLVRGLAGASGHPWKL